MWLDLCQRYFTSLWSLKQKICIHGHSHEPWKAKVVVVVAYVLHHLLIIIIIIIIIIITKPQAEILELNKVNGCNDILFGDHSILEGDHIPPLKSHGQALEEELCFPGVLSDNRDVRPIFCVTSVAVSCHAPAVSMANGQKMWVLLLLLLLLQWHLSTVKSGQQI